MKVQGYGRPKVPPKRFLEVFPRVANKKAHSFMMKAMDMRKAWLNGTMEPLKQLEYKDEINWTHWD